MKYLLIAGEASGDIHASAVISAIAKLDDKAEFRFFGGDLMAKAARKEPELHYKEMNVMGFSEVIRRLPILLRNLAKAKRLLRWWHPDALILVDYPSFNLKLAKYAHKLGIRVFYFISPKVWAWKEYRVRSIKKYVDRMFSILPFEVPFYAKHGYNVTYVGNPSVQEIDEDMRHLPPVKHFYQRQGIEDDGKPLIALLPGSRKSEIRNNLPLMIEAAKNFPECRYIVAAAPSVPEKFYRLVAHDPGLNLTFGATVTLLKYSQAALVTSGTATLETALVGTPQVVCYRANGRKITYKIMEKLLKVKFVSLPNLIVNNRIVPELLIHNCTPQNISRHLAPLLQPSPEREWQTSGYKSMRRKLGTSVAADYAAELIVSDLKPKPSGTPQETHSRLSPQRRNKQRKNDSVVRQKNENKSVTQSTSVKIENKGKEQDTKIYQPRRKDNNRSRNPKPAAQTQARNSENQPDNENKSPKRQYPKKAQRPQRQRKPDIE
ncbi:MAG: lipid-A-disaccharide synthase [Prevotella sp.]|nr:lipid-A-disaccharide synthase [Bacteroides sp.]MCM1366376.1 lipid-A-disaccharide synthase [Prevotella sp.]MCM1436695.1 lipid-A-disaccharide synthase [Prevotella sp.]